MIYPSSHRRVDAEPQDDHARCFEMVKRAACELKLLINRETGQLAA
jgi:hypothetical protein